MHKLDKLKILNYKFERKKETKEIKREINDESLTA